ncbi:MAG: M20/M25/M40 family metallo-hydrolase, partial [Pseudomonadota bacterium]
MLLKRIVLCIGAACLLLLGVSLYKYASVTERIYAPARAPVWEAPDSRHAAERLAAAIRFRTIAALDGAPQAPADFTAFQNYLTVAFPRAHQALGLRKVNGHGLLYTWPGRDRTAAPAIFLGHYDVVPADESAWSVPPFKGVVQDSFIWGRGALDDKGGVLGLLEAVEGLARAGFQPNRTIYFAFGFDEEVGGRNGAANIARLLAEDGVRAAFVLDEGPTITVGVAPGVARPVALVAVAEKGRATYRLTATGAAGHSSAPPFKTSIGRLSHAVTDLIDHQPRPRYSGLTAGMFLTLAPDLPLAERFVVANAWATRPLLSWVLGGDPALAAFLRTTTAPVFLSAGDGTQNVVPGEAQAIVDFRIAHSDSLEALQRRVEAAAKPYHVSVERLEGAIAPTPIADTDNDAFAAIAGAIRYAFPDVIIAS